MGFIEAITGKPLNKMPDIFSYFFSVTFFSGAADRADVVDGPAVAGGAGAGARAVVPACPGLGVPAVDPGPGRSTRGPEK